MMKMSDYLFYSSTGMIIAGVVTFLGCSYLAAPYGKYTSSKGWGFLLNPKYAWIIMESPNLWIAYLVYVYRHYYSSDKISSNVYNQILLCCFILHYINRSIIYPLRMESNSSAPMPVSVAIAAFIFCCWNGLNQSISLILVNSDRNMVIISEHQFYIGLVIFSIGLFINIQSDQILLIEKKKKKKTYKEAIISNEKGGVRSKYVIPTGGLFEYVSCANYFGEIVEWWGFAIACNSLSAYAFAFYTTAYLTSRSLHYHSWYKEKFDDYPKKRRAVIPFLL